MGLRKVLRNSIFFLIMLTKLYIYIYIYIYISKKFYLLPPVDQTGLIFSVCFVLYI
jgi:hypothetical protein